MIFPSLIFNTYEVLEAIIQQVRNLMNRQFKEFHESSVIILFCNKMPILQYHLR